MSGNSGNERSEYSLTCEPILVEPKPAVSLLSGSILASTAMLILEPSPTVLAAAGSIQLAALVLYRLTQAFLQQRSHSSAQALVRMLRDNEADVTVALGANGELKVTKIRRRTHPQPIQKKQLSFAAHSLNPHAKDRGARFRTAGLLCSSDHSH